MPSITEGKLTFHFRENWRISKYDAWDYYQDRLKDYFGGTKGVDIACLDTAHCLWLIEIKDYREHPREKPEDLSLEIARKARDTLGGLAAAQRLATRDTERTFAQKAMSFQKIRIVLHLEQPKRHSRLFPRKIDLANTKQSLKRLVKSIDAHPLVSEMNQMNGCLWTVETTPNPASSPGRSRRG